MLLLRAKGKEDDDTSDDDPRLSEKHKADRRSKKKKAKAEEKHRSSKDSRSSSDDTRTELFPRRRFFGQLGEQDSASSAGVPRGSAGFWAEGKSLGLRAERELRTLAGALDHLLLGNMAACREQDRRQLLVLLYQLRARPNG